MHPNEHLRSTRHCSRCFGYIPASQGHQVGLHQLQFPLATFSVVNPTQTPQTCPFSPTVGQMGGLLGNSLFPTFFLPPETDLGAEGFMPSLPMSLPFLSDIFRNICENTKDRCLPCLLTPCFIKLALYVALHALIYVDNGYTYYRSICNIYICFAV